MSEDLYVILEWLDNEPAFPRFSLATRKHAAELGRNVSVAQTCCSLESAAAIVRGLNAEAGTAMAIAEREGSPVSEKRAT